MGMRSYSAHTKPIKGTLTALVLLTLLLSTTSAVYAAEGGYTNYVPGFYGDFAVATAPEPGFYLRSDFYLYSAETDRVVQNGAIRADLELTSGMWSLTGLYAFEKTILGGRYAIGAYVPVTYCDISANLTAGAQSLSLDDDYTGIGDIGIIPVSLFWNFGNFHLNAAQTIIIPTGAYDVERDINSGLNYWSFDAVISGTYLDLEHGHEFSAAAGFIYNTENDDTDYQTGTEFHFDYMVNQFFSETFALGIQGFFYTQISGDDGDGALLGDFKAEAAGIGPALMYATQIGGKGLFINAKWLHELHAENRLEGDHLFLNFTMDF
jgi:hypothetical protein